HRTRDRRWVRRARRIAAPAPVSFSEGSRLGQHLALSCGFGITAVMIVPAKRATSGDPYSAAPPRLSVVTCLMVLPKFHSQTLDAPPAMSGWTPIVENG